MDVLPDLVDRLGRIKAGLLMQLLQNQQRLAANLVALRKRMPDIDASDLVVRYPGMLTDLTADDIQTQFDALRYAFEPLSCTVVCCGPWTLLCCLHFDFATNHRPFFQN